MTGFLSRPRRSGVGRFGQRDRGGDPAEAAAGAVRLALLPDDGPAGEFLSWDETRVLWWSPLAQRCPTSAVIASEPGAARCEFEHRRAFRDKVKWRTGSEGRINHIKRSYGWNRTEFTRISGARTWRGTACSPTI